MDAQYLTSQTSFIQALRLSHGARRKATVGEIVNLMSVDAQRVHDAAMLVHEWWISPLSIALCMYMLWLQLGPSSMAGLVLLILLTPINGGYVYLKVAQLQVRTISVSTRPPLLTCN